MKKDKEEIVIDKEELKESFKISIKVVTKALANLRKEYESFVKKRAKIRQELKNGCRKTPGLSI